jgi:hypothetical protein
MTIFFSTHIKRLLDESNKEDNEVFAFIWVPNFIENDGLKNKTCREKKRLNLETNPSLVKIPLISHEHMKYILIT